MVLGLLSNKIFEKLLVLVVQISLNKRPSLIGYGRVKMSVSASNLVVVLGVEIGDFLLGCV